MQTIRFVVLGLLLLSLSVVSVSGQGYAPVPSIVKVPLLGTSGAPALAGSNYAGLISVLYADGQPVVLGSNKVFLNLCAPTSCESIEVPLQQTGPGTYAYSFPIPALSGTVTIYVQAGGLADDNGRIFPSVDTQIGAYAAPTSSSSSLPAEESLPGTPQQSTPVQPLTRQAVVAQPAGHSPIFTVGVVLAVLGLVGMSLLVVPRRKTSG